MMPGSAADCELGCKLMSLRLKRETSCDKNWLPHKDQTDEMHTGDVGSATVSMKKIVCTTCMTTACTIINPLINRP